MIFLLLNRKERTGEKQHSREEAAIGNPAQPPPREARIHD